MITWQGAITLPFETPTADSSERDIVIAGRYGPSLEGRRYGPAFPGQLAASFGLPLMGLGAWRGLRISHLIREEITILSRTVLQTVETAQDLSRTDELLPMLQ